MGIANIAYDCDGTRYAGTKLNGYRRRDDVDRDAGRSRARGRAPAGIVHRDVKPGNLIIQPDGTVVLVDFGVARSAESAALTGAKEVVGTALYIAPEQVSKESTGPSADVYALGVVAYHCLAGHPPFWATARLRWPSST